MLAMLSLLKNIKSLAVGASIDSNMSTSPLTPQQATNNGEFATIVSAPSNNDLSSILSGDFDYSSVGQTFSVWRVAIVPIYSKFNATVYGCRLSY